MLTHVDLFSGIGGFALAARWAGFKTIAFCEIDSFCQEVLKARFGAVADANGFNGNDARLCSGKISQFKKAEIQRYPLLIPDIRDFDGRQFRGAILLTGGFPCQPFSCAGKQRGKEDDRHLWPEMLRVIHEARPAWVIGENVSGFVRMALDEVCADLEGEGYEVQPIIIPACAVNAPHRRDRVWIIAYRTGLRCEVGGRVDTGKRVGQEQTRPYSSQDDSDAPDATEQRLSKPGLAGIGKLQTKDREGVHDRPEQPSWDTPWIEVATRLCRVDVRVPNRVDRLKSLGNSIVSQVAYEICKAIAEIEEAR